MTKVIPWFTVGSHLKRISNDRVKLKRLEIIGFKSFMDQTVISFEKEITGVVGPNGCGKSNVVDAIRWVMGEQSAKHLRGKHMEDVIFAGSETRSPLSMASVELTFSTDGFQTPAAYLNHNEISICRRLYRTGESEYLINKTQVRLKDITDLFLGTGVGTKAYSIIEQGRISQIITAKPEERRYFIEEVAGISKFKSRKEAAQRKIEATRQNILRLNDIIIELERQLKSLDKQAKKAQKYKEVKTEFEKWDLALSANVYDRHNRNQESWESELKSYDEEESLLKTQLLECDNELETFKLDLSDKEAAIQSLTNTLYETTNHIRLGEAALGYKKTEEAGLIKRVAVIDADIEEIEKSLTGLKTGQEQINEQILTAELEEASLCENLREIEADTEISQEDLKTLLTAADSLREELHQAQKRVAQIDTHRAALTQKRDDLSARVSRDEAELSSISKQCQGLEKTYKETASSLDSLKQLKFNLSQQTEEISSELSILRTDLKSQGADLDVLKEDLSLKRSRLSSLEELQRNFEGYQEGTRQVLMKKGDLSADGIFGTVADFIETDSRYESAVSAVLGEKLQYVVVKSQAEGMSAVDYLRTSATGRTSFIPLSLKSVQETKAEVWPEEGVLGSLSKYVNLKNGYEHLSQFLFGDTILVESLQKALDVWGASDARKNLVTLNGELVDEAGVITGGSAETTSRALLEKKREIKELSFVVSELEIDVAEKLERRQKLESKVTELQHALESVKSTSVEEGLRIANQEKDVGHFKKELDGLNIRKTEIERRLETEKSTLSGIQPEIDALFNEEDILKIRLEEITNILASNRQELESKQEAFAEKSGRLTKLKIELAQARERKLYLDTELHRQQDQLVTMRTTLALREKEANTAEARAEFINRESQHLRKVLDKRLTKHTGLESELSGHKQEFDTAMSSLRDRETVLRDLRRRHDDASQRLNRITVSLTEIRGQMKHMAEQSLERHQINLPDVYKNYLDENLDYAEAEMQATELKERLFRMGDVNASALEEFEELSARFEFLNRQKQDLEASLDALERVIHKINRTSREKFLETFHLVNEQFQKVFPRLFHGGQAKLVLTNEEDLLETGVEVVAQPPGKRLQSISLLSGGEKALTAVSLIFAIFLIKPSPFCILDEVDAPLDDVNVGRYNDMIREMTGKTQFIVITHNKKTMEMTDVLYGVTMQEAGVSQLVSVDMQ